MQVRISGQAAIACPVFIQRGFPETHFPPAKTEAKTRLIEKQKRYIQSTWREILKFDKAKCRRYSSGFQNSTQLTPLHTP
jgi:hypothetical protein